METLLTFLFYLAWFTQGWSWYFLLRNMYKEATRSSRSIAFYPFLPWIILILISGLWLGVYYIGS